MCRLKSLPDVRNDREGGAKVEGKIEGHGTREHVSLGLHVGCGGTPPARRGAPGQVKGREEKNLGRASSDRARWSWRDAWA